MRIAESGYSKVVGPSYVVAFVVMFNFDVALAGDSLQSGTSNCSITTHSLLPPGYHVEECTALTVAYDVSHFIELVFT